MSRPVIESGKSRYRKQSNKERERERARKAQTKTQRKKKTTENLLGGNIAALLHQRADREPERVEQREAVLQKLRVRVTGMGILPLVRRETVSCVFVFGRGVEFFWGRKKERKKSCSVFGRCSGRCSLLRTENLGPGNGHQVNLIKSCSPRSIGPGCVFDEGVCLVLLALFFSFSRESSTTNREWHVNFIKISIFNFSEFVL